MYISDIIRILGADKPVDFSDREITTVVCNSKKAVPDCVFICLRGSVTDGHLYTADAAKRGAVCIIAEKGAEYGETGDALVIETENTRRATALIYSALNGNPAEKLKIIAVTGTNGKTSVTFMLKAVFEAAGYSCGLIGTVCRQSPLGTININSDNELANMTTPDPEQLYGMLAVMVREKADYVFMEATSHALALHKLDGIVFDCAVFTNLTPEHLDFHRSMENYLAAKLRLFSQSRQAVINIDGKYSNRILKAVEELKIPYKSCTALNNFADCRAIDIKNKGKDGVGYTYISKGAIFSVSCPILGGFTVINSMQAATVALEYGIAPYIIRNALSTLWGINGRIERVNIEQRVNFSVFIDYAHTPDALENLLRTAQSIREPGGRIVLVFGCGGDRDKTKRGSMGRIASCLADEVVITSDNSRSEAPEDIIHDILCGVGSGCAVKVIQNRRDAIDFVIKTAVCGDIILLAGKGHEAYEIDRSGRHDFDEKAVVRSAAKKYYGNKT